MLGIVTSKSRSILTKEIKEKREKAVRLHRQGDLYQAAEILHELAVIEAQLKEKTA